MKTITEVFGVKTKQPIEVAKACPLGSGSNVKPDPKFVFSPQIVRRVLNNIRIQQPMWIWGPSGCGKTELMRQFGARLDREVHILSFGEETSIRELLGTYELVKTDEGVVTRYRHGSLTRAIQVEHAIVVFDEINMAPPGVTAMLNRLLEAREITIPDTAEVISCATGVAFAATANTAGGIDSTGMYAGSQVQNGATRNRFVGLKVDYQPPAVEAEIVRNSAKLSNGMTIDDIIQLGNKMASDVMVEVARACRSLIEEGKLSQPFSVRTLCNWAISSLANQSLVIGFLDAYLDLLDPHESVAVIELFKKITGIDPETEMPAGG